MTFELRLGEEKSETKGQMVEIGWKRIGGQYMTGKDQDLMLHFCD